MLNHKLAKQVLSGAIHFFPLIFLVWMLWIWDKDRQEDIDFLADRLGKYINLQVETEINSYLNAPHDILNATKNAIELNDDIDLKNLRFEDLEKMETLFERPFENSKDLKMNSIQIATAQGYFLGREKDEKAKTRTTKINDLLFQIVNEKPDGWEVMKPFNPTSRPWYNIETGSKKPIWSKVYCDRSTKKRVITAALSLYKEDSDSENLIAVLGNDLLLSEIHDFLKDVVNGLGSSSIFIVERKSIGLVSDSIDVASALKNHSASSECEPDDEIVLPRADESGDPLIEETTSYLEEQEAFDATNRKNQDYEFKFKGERKFVRVFPIQQKNLDWSVVLVLSEDAILAQENFENQNSNWLFSLVLILPLSVLLSVLYTREQRREKQFAIASSRFVPEEILNLLGKTIDDIVLGDRVQQEMTIMFADVRSFTSLSENIGDPDKIFAFVNGYLGRVSPIIRENNGVVDKYLGDGIMALFPLSAEDALKAAISMQSKIVEYNRHRVKSNYSPIAIGIGLHIGSVILGTVGEDKRIETTVISNAVNLAARLEGLTKLYGAKILISADTLYKLIRSEKLQPIEYHHRFLSRVKVKGQNQTVAVYEIYDAEIELPAVVSYKDRTKPEFFRAIILFHQKKFEEALKIFEQIGTLHNEEGQVLFTDLAADRYARRCRDCIDRGVPENWDGTEDFN